jgi:hypothetical protein
MFRCNYKNLTHRILEDIIQQSLWGAEFTLSFAEAFSERNDIFNFAGSLTRILKYIP